MLYVHHRGTSINPKTSNFHRSIVRNGCYTFLPERSCISMSCPWRTCSITPGNWLSLFFFLFFQIFFWVRDANPASSLTHSLNKFWCYQSLKLVGWNDWDVLPLCSSFCLAVPSIGCTPWGLPADCATQRGSDQAQFNRDRFVRQRA